MTSGYIYIYVYIIADDNDGHTFSSLMSMNDDNV
jgi:hypothetical protein